VDDEAEQASAAVPRSPTPQWGRTNKVKPRAIANVVALRSPGSADGSYYGRKMKS
jgi:hypothetical protein